MDCFYVFLKSKIKNSQVITACEVNLKIDICYI